MKEKKATMSFSLFEVLDWLVGEQQTKCCKARCRPCHPCPPPPTPPVCPCAEVIVADGQAITTVLARPNPNKQYVISVVNSGSITVYAPSGFQYDGETFYSATASNEIGFTLQLTAAGNTYTAIATGAWVMN